MDITIEVRPKLKLETVGATLSQEDGVVYLISYDSGRQKETSKLPSYVQRTFPACARVLPSQYLIHSEASALSLLLDLRKNLEVDEGILVSEVTQNVAWHCLKISEDAMEDWEARARECE
jgi:hypothetical protein